MRRENLAREPGSLVEDSEEDVLGADVVVPEPERLTQRGFQHGLGSRGERDAARRRTDRGTHDADHVCPSCVEGDSRLLEHLRRDAISLGEQTEQQVFGADVVVRQAPRLLLRQHDDRAGPIGEAFEHVLMMPTLSIPCSYHGLLIWSL